MSIKEIVIGGALTLVVGGTAYTVNQADVVDNFAEDTGLTQQEAKEYVEQIDDEDLVSFDKVGTSYVESGNSYVDAATEIDCVSYVYEWESTVLSCQAGKSQIMKFGKDEIALGNSYIRMSSDDASASDMTATIRRIDDVNTNYDLEIIKMYLTFSEIDESKKLNSYNKATIEAALQGNQ